MTRIATNTGIIRNSIPTPSGGLPSSAQMAGISMPPPTMRNGTSGTPQSIAGRVQPLKTGSLSELVSEFISGFMSGFMIRCPGSGRRNQHAGDHRRAPNEDTTDKHVRDVAEPGMLE